jgi:hypothetical protein
MKKFKQTQAKRLHVRKQVADWRKSNPEQARQHYRNYWLKKKGTSFRPKHPRAYYSAFEKKKGSMIV